MESFFFPGPEAVEPKNEYICVNILSAGASSCNEKQFSRSWSYTLKHFLFDLLEKTTWAVIHLYKFMFQAISVHWGLVPMYWIANASLRAVVDIK